MKSLKDSRDIAIHALNYVFSVDLTSRFIYHRVSPSNIERLSTSLKQLETKHWQDVFNAIDMVPIKENIIRGPQSKNPAVTKYFSSFGHILLLELAYRNNFPTTHGFKGTTSTMIPFDVLWEAKHEQST